MVVLKTRWTAILKKIDEILCPHHNPVLKKRHVLKQQAPKSTIYYTHIITL